MQEAGTTQQLEQRKTNIRHVPYFVRRTLNANSPIQTEEIYEDNSKGLRTYGRAGYIYCDGPGSIEVNIYDGKEWSGWMLLNSGEGINIFYEDNIWIHRIRIKPGRNEKATYVIAINPGLEGGE